MHGRFEFVIGMLHKLDAIKMDDVDMFVKLFETMDVDGSGTLDAEDMRAGIEERTMTLRKMNEAAEEGYGEGLGAPVEGLASAFSGLGSAVGDSFGGGPSSLGVMPLGNFGNSTNHFGANALSSATSVFKG